MFLRSICECDPFQQIPSGTMQLYFTITSAAAVNKERTSNQTTNKRYKPLDELSRSLLSLSDPRVPIELQQ